MAYNEELAERVREGFPDSFDVTERKMFGGIAFMLHGHMCVGVIKDDLVVRADPERAEAMLEDPHVRPMDFTGKPMKGFLYVAPDGTGNDEALEEWIGKAVSFVETLPPKS